MTTMQVKDLLPYAENARKGNVELIAESLATLGQYRPIVVNEGSLTGRHNEVLVGNHTVLAAQALGWESLDVHRVDVDDSTARRIVLVDNRSSDLATYDDAALVLLLQQLAVDELAATGFTERDLDDLLLTLSRDDVVPLDELAESLGEPTEQDGWVTVAFKVPPTLAAAWTDHLSGFGGDHVAGLRALLGV
jgi:site-specific DNA-methyltransferase (adenine-specific)